MKNTIILKCSNCGGNLEITSDITTFACGYCGLSQIVERAGGIISLKALTDAISKVQIGTDKTAAELAIKRLKEELNEVNEKGKNLEKINANYFYFNLQIFGLAILLIWILVSISAIKYANFITHSIVIGIFITLLASCLFFYKNNLNKLRYKSVITKLLHKKAEIEKKLSIQKQIVDE